jgi:hypothetical protein
MQDAVPPPVTTADNELFPLQTQTGGCYTTEGGVMAVASAYLVHPVSDTRGGNNDDSDAERPHARLCLCCELGSCADSRNL